MSMARVVIMAVVLEGRAKSEVARDYGVSRRWVQVLVARYLAEGEAAFEPRSRRPHTSPRRTSQAVEDAIVALHKNLAEAGHDAGRRPSPGICASRTAARRRWRRSGGSCPAAGLSPRSRTSGPARLGTDSRRTCPTSAAVSMARHGP